MLPSISNCTPQSKLREAPEDLDLLSLSVVPPPRCPRRSRTPRKNCLTRQELMAAE